MRCSKNIWWQCMLNYMDLFNRELRVNNNILNFIRHDVEKIVYNDIPDTIITKVVIKLKNITFTNVRNNVRFNIQGNLRSNLIKGECSKSIKKSVLKIFNGDI